MSTISRQYLGKTERGRHCDLCEKPIQGPHYRLFGGEVVCQNKRHQEQAAGLLAPGTRKIPKRRNRPYRIHLCLECDFMDSKTPTPAMDWVYINRMPPLTDQIMRYEVRHFDGRKNVLIGYVYLTENKKRWYCEIPGLYPLGPAIFGGYENRNQAVVKALVEFPDRSKVMMLYPPSVRTEEGWQN